ncbi:unnamed protein product [Dracunculus medinensis]|uniref:Calx-beta domain-containing protein n=1 Tax=Dracunculus medinensis TaxID=318479 RepID=A0A158Q624_DRAME|nr:unnamed protein product [Dracunculus medinensis]
MLPYLLIISLLQTEYCASGRNCSTNDEIKNCVDGIIIPIWKPFSGLTLIERISRGLIFFMIIAYFFLGVSVVADRFMSSIEVITSMERTITIKRYGIEPFKIKVRIWNDTVSNLTLMALGSSAPEILLSIIEIIGKRFQAGDLGPNTIVGSAAFNLFMIIAICVIAVPNNEVRRQKHLDVFCVTATWSIFAYIWMYIILAIISPGIIEIWEGFLTFLFFPITVITAWIADVKIIQKRFLPHRYRSTGRGLIATEGEEVDEADPVLKAFEDNRAKFIQIMKDLRKKHPEMDPTELEKLAEYEIINQGPKSRAFYRVQATRRLVGGGDIIKKRVNKDHHKSLETLLQREEESKKNTCRIFFEPAHYTVMENIGQFDVVVRREDGPDDITLMVDYHTEDGSAEAGSDYIRAQGTLTFHPGERHKEITIEILDDDVFEEDEHFYLHLTNLRMRTADNRVTGLPSFNGAPVACIEMPYAATIMILDDDHAGVFAFKQGNFQVNENCGFVSLKVWRTSGCRGKVILPYRTYDGSAVAGNDYSTKENEIVFDNNQTEGEIQIGILDTGQYERTDYFFVELYQPIWTKKMSERYCSTFCRSRHSDDLLYLDSKHDKINLTSEQLEIAELGKPRLGDIKTCKIIIKESKEFQSVIDRMLRTANSSLMLGTSSWREQFVDALTVSASGISDRNTGESTVGGNIGNEKEGNEPKFMDYLMHFVCVPWKLVFATIPPTEYWGGWACFIVSIALIGLFTAVIGDLASHFGCWIGLKDAVTAISFVALGTSIPDTFASKVAAIQDKYADSSIGNVTGSNAVNVFLGIGMAWTLAAIYHWFNGSEFYVDPGTLAFSVTIFCIEALVCITVIILRRHPIIGGELGGPFRFKVTLISKFF